MTVTLGLRAPRPTARNEALPRLLAKGRWRLVAGLVLCGLSQALAGAVTVWAIRAGIDATRLSQPVAIAVLALLAAGAAAMALRVVEKRLSETLGQHYVGSVRQRLLTAVGTMPTDTLGAFRKGALVLRYTGDLSAIKTWTGRGLARVLTALMTIPLLLASLSLIDGTLGLAVAVPVVAALMAIAALAATLEAGHRAARAKRGSLSVTLVERVSSPLTMRFATSLAGEKRRLTSLHRAAAREAVRRGTRSALVRAIADGAGALALALVVAVGSVAVSSGDLSSGALVAAVAMVGLVVQPLRELAGVQDHRRAFRAAAARLTPILDAAKNVPVPEPCNTRSIALTALVTHPGAEPLSTRIEAGECVVLDGPSGAGKSTLLRVLAGASTPVSGTLSRPGETAFVAPEIVPFKGSVRRIMRFHVATEDEGLREALAAAGALEAIEARGGLDAAVAEGGSNLPLSLRMRLMLAIALLRAPELLLVDEADLLGPEGLVALSRLAAGGKTTLIAVQRGKTIAPHRRLTLHPAGPLLPTPPSEQHDDE